MRDHVSYFLSYMSNEVVKCLPLGKRKKKEEQMHFIATG